MIHKGGVSDLKKKRQINREEKKVHNEKKTKSHSRKQQLQLSNDPSRSRSHDNLMGVASKAGPSRHILPNVKSGYNGTC